MPMYFSALTCIAAVRPLTDVICHTNLDFISWMVGRIDGWDNPCMVLKIASETFGNQHCPTVVDVLC